MSEVYSTTNSNSNQPIYNSVIYFIKFGEFALFTAGKYMLVLVNAKYSSAILLQNNRFQFIGFIKYISFNIIFFLLIYIDFSKYKV